MKAMILRNCRSWASAPPSRALMPGSNRLARASSTASLSCMSSPSCWRVSSTSLLAIAARGLPAAMRVAQLTALKCEPRSTTWRGRISDSCRQSSL
ncbi:hypothetical protein D3C76_1216620 [compost metagenome]